MFTGIVQGTAKVVQIDKKERFQTHVIELDGALIEGLEIGASVAHNGCCLTVTNIDGNRVSFDLMQATLALTNLGLLEEGSAVNVERAAKFGDEIGGHSMSGHISLMANIVDVIDTPNNRTIWFELPQESMKYVLAKGYIGIDGCSLTIGEVEANRFSVHLIPETLQRTLFGSRKVGDKVNIEFDPQTQAIVDTVERVLAAKQL
ncbi:riboflavin synthase subunit alpha [Vibrio parahaemolyticus]|uniref:riboflavin synthase subunit alpha n=1 Tax=Vibrio parahaemolyticus TaxID=670 RepID=UPI0011211DCB|nr:riboflavin synthase subunit alpha [Vibrio parahaemolyticus]EGQ9121227.1 riboflavin synthase subunit alpha [Vibrio parahaemolyticus]EGQ9475306.1 riboflavin synthase subunit alpha [Vibrio parahaemolyticus]EGR1224380.1 riboflavin synthase subunit alpha [Vibrio parahaemolyticus]EJC6797351.1 riboflavin synthase subunit alpha [Vibrio parahaemolyticus]EJC7055524.1 riboflavin synthase subunit alpha [Vibrio parahaemolyticus]